MLSVERYEHTVPLFTDADILPLIFFNTNPFFLTHDIRNQKVPSGNILKPIFSDTTSFHYYDTRYSSSNNFYVKKLAWKSKREFLQA